MSVSISLLSCDDWQDYELLDSGRGLRLERFGPYRFIRPEHQAVWRPALGAGEWQKAHAAFQASADETGGRWEVYQTVEPAWIMQYKNLKFWARMSNSRHLGVFPEQAVHWDWIIRQAKRVSRPLKVLNLFGYTGLASLAAALTGAQVTHVDASKKSVAWARQNQALAGLNDKPVRWIVDDAIKFVQRESRRGQVYDGLILDPPKFGRGPKGEVWEFFERLSDLLQDCRAVLSQTPQFVVLTAYAIRASAVSLYYAVQEMMAGLSGTSTAGELVIRERSAGRLISAAIFVRWCACSDEVHDGGRR